MTLCSPAHQSQRMHVALESPRQPDVVALIAELDAYQDTLYPAEARYAHDLDSLAQPNVLFGVARDDGGRAVGCGAIVLNEAYGEIKRHILAALESEALARGCGNFMLETGPCQPDALAFYGKQGYVRCGPFGDYPDHPLSVFMHKQVTAVVGS